MTRSPEPAKRNRRVVDIHTDYEIAEPKLFYDNGTSRKKGIQASLGFAPRAP